MPIVTLTFDEKKRPVLNLLVSPSAAESAWLRLSGLEVPAPQEVTALVDTGANKTKIVRSVLVDALHLQPVGVVNEYTASTGTATVERCLYAVCLTVAEVPYGVLAYNIEVSEAENLSGLGVKALLGRDILDEVLLVYRGPGAGSTLAFNIPNPPIV